MCLPWQQIGRWGLTIVMVWMVMLWGWVPGASASMRCRDIDGHRVCLESVKRSAKYSWEYRVVTSVDGRQQPSQRYDCRRTQPEALTESPQGKDVPALESELRAFICERVHR